MKYIATSNITCLGSDLGNPAQLVASKGELDTVANLLSGQCGWVGGAGDYVDIPSNTDVSFGQLWNWTGNANNFGAVRPEPLLGVILKFTASEVNLPAGAQVEVRWVFGYQPSRGYNGTNTAPSAIVHSGLFQLNGSGASCGAGAGLIGILGAQVVSGRSRLALPYISTSASPGDNSLRVNGIPAGVTVNMRAITRYDVDLLTLWPDLAERVAA